MKKCRVQDNLVREITALNNSLNTLSPTWIHDEQAREEIEERRQTLRVEIKQHRTKGHEGKKCPAFDPRSLTLLPVSR